MAGPRKPHIHNVLQRGKAEGGSRGIYDAVNGLPEIAAPVNADPNCYQFEELFDGADQQEAYLCGLQEVFLWQDGPCDILQSKCGNSTGAPPEKHATNISKRPLILAGLPVEIPQPKQSGHEPQNRKNRTPNHYLGIDFVGLGPYNTELPKSQGFDGSQQAGRAMLLARRRNQEQSFPCNRTGILPVGGRANDRQSRVSSGTVPQCKWHNTCERLH